MKALSEIVKENKEADEVANKKIERIIDIIEEELTIEKDCHIEMEVYAYIHNKDKQRVIDKIKKILEE